MYLQQKTITEYIVDGTNSSLHVYENSVFGITELLF